MQLRKITLSTAFVRDENGEIMSIVCVFRQLDNAHDQLGSGGEVVKDVVRELAERLRVMLQMKEDQDAKDGTRQAREVG